MASQVPRLLRECGLAGERIAAPFPLWLVRFDDACAARLARDLSPAEQARALRFRHDPLRRRYLAAHCARRLLVEAECGLPAATQQYMANAWDKPFLAGAPDVHCSISYGGDSVLVGLSIGAEIGIDIEPVRPIADHAELAGLHYTDREVAQLRDQRPERSDHAFLTVWVRKEACVKALGMGLSIAPSSFECGVGSGLRDVLVENEMLESSVLNPKDDLLASWARRGQLRI